MVSLGVDTINALIGVTDAMYAPQKLMETMLHREEREALFRRFLDADSHLEVDCFQEYFEQEQAQRKTQKQDFTPNSVSEVLNQLVGNKQSASALDVCAGTGGITIRRWWQDCLAHEPFFDYRPSMYWYKAEELSPRAIPFLLFNLSIRGMNATVIHGDTLDRKIRNVFFILNFDDDMLHFSDINVLPRTKTVTRHFDVCEWVGEPIDHIERIRNDLADLAEGLSSEVHDDETC